MSSLLNVEPPLFSMLNNIFESDKKIGELLLDLKNKLRVYAKSDNMPKKFIFICGKQKDNDKNSPRNWLMNKLETSDSKIKCLIAEDLYFSQDYNILTFENLLAEISDDIIIILESPGTFCELGAFVNKQNLTDKLIVINEDNPSFEKSFISLGPLKKIKKENLLLYQGKFTRSPKINDLIYNIKGKPTSKVIHNDLSKPIELKSLICELLNIVFLFAPICDYEIEYVYQKIFDIPAIDIKNKKEHGISNINTLLKLLYKLDLISYNKGYYSAKEDVQFKTFAFLWTEEQICTFRSEYLARLYKLDKERLSAL